MATPQPLSPDPVFGPLDCGSRDGRVPNRALPTAMLSLALIPALLAPEM